jgi:hypothetical protein
VEGVLVDESDGVVPDAAVTANSDAMGLSEIQTARCERAFSVSLSISRVAHCQLEGSLQFGEDVPESH